MKRNVIKVIPEVLFMGIIFICILFIYSFIIWIYLYCISIKETISIRKVFITNLMITFRYQVRIQYQELLQYLKESTVLGEKVSQIFL
eukprot:snap_masked-scaffold_28-processed-gene-2.36-mRNA-1 protein AED:1.00 eAED:1.00 QI:0/0/0/0/1/1/2/0/87